MPCIHAHMLEELTAAEITPSPSCCFSPNHRGLGSFSSAAWLTVASHVSWLLGIYHFLLFKDSAFMFSAKVTVQQWHQWEPPYWFVWHGSLEMVLSVVEMEPIPNEGFTWNLLGPFRDTDVKIKWLHWHPSPTMGLWMENPIPGRFSTKGNTNLSETQVLELPYWKDNTNSCMVHFPNWIYQPKPQVKQNQIDFGTGGGKQRQIV